MQGTWVWSLVQEDSTCHGTTKPVCHNYWSLHALEPMICNKKSHHDEKPMHCNEEESPLATTRESPRSSNEDPAQPQANTENYLKKQNTLWVLWKGTRPHLTQHLIYCLYPQLTFHYIFTYFCLLFIIGSSGKVFHLFLWPGSMWDPSSLLRDPIHAPCTEAQSLNHWTAWEVPHLLSKVTSLSLNPPAHLWLCSTSLLLCFTASSSTPPVKPTDLLPNEAKQNKTALCILQPHN